MVFGSLGVKDYVAKVKTAEVAEAWDKKKGKKGAWWKLDKDKRELLFWYYDSTGKFPDKNSILRHSFREKEIKEKKRKIERIKKSGRELTPDRLRRLKMMGVI